MARIARAALAVGASVAALVGGTTTAHARSAAEPAEGVVVHLEAGESNRCLSVGGDSTATNGAPAYLDFCTTAWKGPVWRLVATEAPTRESSFELRSMPGGKCLEVADGSDQAGAAIQLGECSGAKRTRWQIDLVDPVRKVYQVRALHAAERCLDVPYGNHTEGVRLQQYPCNQTTAQLWRIKPVTAS
ncbi:RICIN domain-containing protein [Streptomyces sp. NPDC059851]|uniref:RICIN domain-containing protein n=1 Tax=Streptomyces sp. NPDC059851 TaxID=3346971 RepID=UPI0036699E2B